MMANDALTLKNVCKNYGDFSLKNVSFSLPQGTIMGFIGENGAGKTTTIKAILNLIHKDSGEISVFGLDHMKNEREVKNLIGVVFDENSFLSTFTPKDIGKIMAGIYSGWENTLYKKYLTRFSLPDNKKIQTFSRGMQMKLSIAVALAHSPRLLLLDEATSGLDPVMRNEILDIFLEYIQNENHSVLLSSHITSDLEKIADYITFIHQGSIIFSERTDILKEKFGVVRCTLSDFDILPKEQICGYRKEHFGAEVLVKERSAVSYLHPNLIIDPASIEDIMLYYGKTNYEKSSLSGKIFFR